jgi:hypothetical protein
MSDPIELPKALPLNSLRVLLQVARGEHALDECVAASGLTVLGYVAGLYLPAHDAAAQETAPAATIAEALESAIASAEPQPAAALSVNWKQIAEFIITIVVKAII